MSGWREPEPDLEDFATEEERARAAAYWATIRDTVRNARPEIEVARGFEIPPVPEPETPEQLHNRYLAEGPPVVRTQQLVDQLRAMGARVIVEERAGPEDEASQAPRAHDREWTTQD